MSVKPILFSAPMVRAILDGRKGQTRRIVKRQPTTDRSGMIQFHDGGWFAPSVVMAALHYAGIKLRYAPGDLLWVRESFVIESNREYRSDWQPPDDGRPIRKVDDDPDWGESERIPHYRATDGEPNIVSYDQDPDDDRTRWKPSIHMPRWASRLTLEVTAVKVERLQEISEEDAQAEGVERDTEPCDHHRQSCADIGCLGPTYKASFCELWAAINGPGSWKANPFVVAVSFGAHRQNIDAFLAKPVASNPSREVRE